MVRTSTVSLAETGSGWPPATTAVLVRTAPSRVVESMVTRISSVSLWPWTKSPTFQTTSAPVTGSTVPWLGAADLKVTPVGRVSVTTTPVAVPGPGLSLVTVRV